jgi:L-threonylcarbamoyladenylate synthase
LGTHPTTPIIVSQVTAKKKTSKSIVQLTTKMTIVSKSELIIGAIAGKVVSFPTDTVPALGALPKKAGLIFAKKKRQPDKPLILMGACAEDLWNYVRGSAGEFARWREIAERYWGGALTLVLPASEIVPKEMNPHTPNTIGIRVPDCRIAQEILSQTGPLATTSANLSGKPPLRTMKAITEEFPDLISLEEEESEVQGSGLPSTVAKWTGEGWEILRQGSIVLS